jgi:hypothetical protein
MSASIEKAGAWKSLYERCWSHIEESDVLQYHQAPSYEDYKGRFKIMYLGYDKRPCDHCGDSHSIMSDYSWFCIIDNAQRDEREYELYA